MPVKSSTMLTKNNGILTLLDRNYRPKAMILGKVKYSIVDSLDERIALIMG